MASTKLSKVVFNRTKADVDFATEAELRDFLQVLKAKSNLPIKQMLAMLSAREADTVSCSREDTNYSFFASYTRKGIAITVKKLGEETIEFSIPHNEMTKIRTLN
jgi:phosphoribosyl-ATP pyrophosphohydrolase